jgi:hypothetical protein
LIRRQPRLEGDLLDTALTRVPRLRASRPCRRVPHGLWRRDHGLQHRACCGRLAVARSRRPSRTGEPAPSPLRRPGPAPSCSCRRPCPRVPRLRASRPSCQVPHGLWRRDHGLQHRACCGRFAVARSRRPSRAGEPAPSPLRRPGPAPSCACRRPCPPLPAPTVGLTLQTAPGGRAELGSGPPVRSGCTPRATRVAGVAAAAASWRAAKRSLLAAGCGRRPSWIRLAGRDPLRPRPWPVRATGCRGGGRGAGTPRPQTPPWTYQGGPRREPARRSVGQPRRERFRAGMVT